MGRRAATQLAGRLARCLQTSSTASGGCAQAAGSCGAQRGGQVRVQAGIDAKRSTPSFSDLSLLARELGETVHELVLHAATVAG